MTLRNTGLFLSALLLAGFVASPALSVSAHGTSGDKQGVEQRMVRALTVVSVTDNGDGTGSIVLTKDDGATTKTVAVDQSTKFRIADNKEATLASLSAGSTVYVRLAKTDDGSLRAAVVSDQPLAPRHDGQGKPHRRMPLLSVTSVDTEANVIVVTGMRTDVDATKTITVHYTDATVFASAEQKGELKSEQDVAIGSQLWVIGEVEKDSDTTAHVDAAKVILIK